MKRKATESERWAKVNVRIDTMKNLKKLAPKLRMSVAGCVSEAIEVWKRDVVPSRLKLVNPSAKD